MYSATRSNVFITAILGRVDAVSGALEIVNAGHPGPLLLWRERVEVQPEGLALPLSIEPDERYEVQRIEPQRDLQGVLFYTDGLIEAASPAGQLLRIAPVAEKLAALGERSTQAVLDVPLALVRAHLGPNKNMDDLTLMVLQYLAPAQS
jgi:serine phosphatase RsbU (regulator of sigma subunit)